MGYKGMIMDNMEVLTWALGLICTVLLGVLSAIWKHKNDVHKEIFNRLVAQEQALNEFKIKVAEKYATAEMVKELTAKLEKALVDGLHEVSTSLNKLAEEFHEHQLEGVKRRADR